MLTHFGCIVEFPAAQTCCGVRALEDGLHDAAQLAARHFVEVFEKADYIVTPSPACCVMVREHYPQLLGDDPAYEEGMWNVAGRTYDFVEFLTAVLEADLSGLSLPAITPLAMHVPCHISKLGIIDQTSAAVEQIDKTDLRSLPQPQACCGAGGNFGDRFTSISAVLAAAKAKDIRATGATRFICNEPLCAAHITTMDGAIKPVHIAELIATALKLDSQRW